MDRWISYFNTKDGNLKHFTRSVGTPDGKLAEKEGQVYQTGSQFNRFWNMKMGFSKLDHPATPSNDTNCFSGYYYALQLLMHWVRVVSRNQELQDYPMWLVKCSCCSLVSFQSIHVFLENLVCGCETWCLESAFLWFDFLKVDSNGNVQFGEFPPMGFSKQF